MTANVFVDTNVLIYAVDSGDPFKQRIAQRWRSELWKRRAGRISYQVLQEYYASVTRKWAGARLQVRDDILDLISWQPVTIDFVLLDVAWKVQDRHKLSFWDALIVAGATAASCKYLLTEDLQNGQRIEGVTVVNPFSLDPAEIFGD
ncbi:MAG: PIN domain-containing protein [Candidatus Korobacteraceae bacterium]